MRRTILLYVSIYVAAGTATYLYEWGSACHRNNEPIGCYMTSRDNENALFWGAYWPVYWPIEVLLLITHRNTIEGMRQ